MTVVSMSKQEFSRLEVLLGVQSGRLRVTDACELIGLQRRQVFRLLRGLKENGVWTSPRGVEGSLRNPDTSGGRYGRKANPATVYGSLQGASGQTGGGGRPRAVRGGH